MTDGEARNREAADPEARNFEAADPDAAGLEAADGAAQNAAHRSARPARVQRRSMLLRLDPAVHDALAAWASHDLRSLNAHVEWLLRRALDDAGRLPKQVAPQPRRGRPRGTR